MKKIILFCMVLLTLGTVFCSCGKTNDLDSFFEKIDKIESEFTHEGYFESGYKKPYVALLPEEYTKIDIAADYLTNQKTLAYKSEDSDTVIYLQMFPNAEKNSWNGCWMHSEGIFEKVDREMLGDFPDMGASFMTFSYDGIFYSIMCVSSTGGYETDSAGSQMMSFANDFIDYITE